VKRAIREKERQRQAPLRCFVYEGCDDATLRRRGLSFADVDPRYLSANYDIIFISLKKLSSEFHQIRATTSSAGNVEIIHGGDILRGGDGGGGDAEATGPTSESTGTGRGKGRCEKDWFSSHH
jgi:hypothetical protein